MGGKQFWTDQLHFHKYRVQQNVVTGHHRLIDPNDMRLAWGNFAACTDKLAKIAAKENLRGMTGEVVILLHGLTRTRSTMQPLADYLEKNGDVTVINLTYASTRATLDQHAAALHSVISRMPDVTEVSFVGHSLGNIVVRQYLSSDEGKNEKRLKRMVMLGPPNHGSRIATVFENNVLFKTFWGVSGQQLTKNSFKELADGLAIPEFDFGIVAGDQPDDASLTNPLLDGDNDMVVTVEETRLEGAADFVQRPVIHSTMMKDEGVHELTLKFLENGYFESADKRQPIERTSQSQDRKSK